MESVDLVVAAKAPKCYSGTRVKCFILITQTSFPSWDTEQLPTSNAVSSSPPKMVLPFVKVERNN